MTHPKFARKAIAIALVAMLLSTSALAPRRASAFVGGAPSVIAAGFITIAAGAAIGLTGMITSIAAFPRGTTRDEVGGFSALAGIVAFVVGIILLDDESGPSLQYAPLTGAQATQLGVSADEAEQYRQDLPEINAIAQQISQDLLHDGVTELNDNALHVAAAKWAAYGAGLAPASLTVVQKIGASAQRGSNP